MAMTNTARELKKSIDDMMLLCKRKIVEEAVESDEIDPDGFEALRIMFNMCELCTKLTCEQAELMEKMNRKLDRLLETK